MRLKLSEPQLRFLKRCKVGPYYTPFTGGRDAGTTASAWYRTARALRDLGCIGLERWGDHERATITQYGLKQLEED